MKPGRIVVIVDDDEDVRELLGIIAETKGLQPMLAGDCQTGIELVRQAGDRVALVLLDYFMPGMRPVECSRAIVGLTDRRAAVVLVTAAVDPAERARSLALRYYVGKPFDLDSLEWVWRLANGVAS